jgi:outer membrane protein assembly factor BamB
MTLVTARSAIPWSCAGGDFTRSGLSPLRVQLDPQPLYHLQAQGALQASVVFDADDRALVADMSGCIRAFAADRLLLWQVHLDGPISATPAVDPVAGHLYVGTNHGWLCALRTSDGHTLWRRKIPTQSDPRILSDLLYLRDSDRLITSSWGGQFLAVEGASGTMCQSWDAGISPQSGAMADTQGRAYCLRAVEERGIEWLQVSPDGVERVLHREPGKERPVRRVMVSAAPVLDAARHRGYAIMNRNGSARLLAWSIVEDRLLWSHELPAAVVATPTVRADGCVLVSDLSGQVLAVDSDGQRRFSYSAGCEYLLAGSVSDVGNTTFLGDPWGRLHVLAPGGKGEVAFESERAVQARPSLDRHGHLFLPGTDHTVRVFRNLLSPGLLDAGRMSGVDET